MRRVLVVAGLPGLVAVPGGATAAAGPLPTGGVVAMATERLQVSVTRATSGS